MAIMKNLHSSCSATATQLHRSPQQPTRHSDAAASCIALCCACGINTAEGCVKHYGSCYVTTSLLLRSSQNLPDRVMQLRYAWYFHVHVASALQARHAGLHAALRKAWHAWLHEALRKVWHAGLHEAWRKVWHHVMSLPVSFTETH